MITYYDSLTRLGTTHDEREIFLCVKKLIADRKVFSSEGSDPDVVYYNINASSVNSESKTSLKNIKKAFRKVSTHDYLIVEKAKILK